MATSPMQAFHGFNARDIGLADYRDGDAGADGATLRIRRFQAAVGRPH